MGFKAIEFHGDRLTYRRNRQGIKMEDLAKKINRSKGYISNLETGTKNNPGIDVINSLARELDVDALYFFADPLPIDHLPPMSDKMLDFLIDENNTIWLQLAMIAKESGHSCDAIRNLLLENQRAPKQHSNQE